MARLRADWRATSALLGTAVFGKLLGCAALYLVLTGMGIHLGLATTLLVYTLTIMASLIGPLPGGIGVADASLGALLIANGVPAAAAAGAVIAFRLLDLWLPLFVGAVAGGHHWRTRTDASDDLDDETTVDGLVSPPVPQPVLAAALAD